MATQLAQIGIEAQPEIYAVISIQIGCQREYKRVSISTNDSGEVFMPTSVLLDVNGRVVTVIVDDPGMPLLYALRDSLGLKGPRFGCGLGQCGACIVLVDDEPVLSCETPLAKVAKGKIVTLEGLGSPERPSPVQQAFIDEQAAQCGYCLNGMILRTTALLAKTKNPSIAQIKNALADNLCRCGTHLRIIRAVQRAARNA
jgi:nicotinate dehydrogenase subunit A